MTSKFILILLLSSAPLVTVYFSPRGGSQDAIVKVLDNAKKSVYAQAYSFTNQEIIDAAIRAKKRGVEVVIVLDKSHLKRDGTASMFKDAGIGTYIDSHHPIAHNKIFIADKRTVCTGSFNFTNAAEKSNAENLLIIDDPELSARYYTNWQVHREHSKPYLGK